MDLTDPFVGLVPRKMSDAELARAIRLNIAAEVDAINLYAAHLDATDNEAARRILAHVIDEEKEHLAEFVELLKILDPKQEQELGEARAKIEAIIAAPGGQTPEDPSALEQVPEAAAARATNREVALGKHPTVGSLRKPKV